MKTFKNLSTTMLLLFTCFAYAECKREASSVLDPKQAQNLQLVENVLIPIPFAEDVSSDIRDLILSDLEWLKNVKGSSSTPMHLEFFKFAVDGESYLKWLLSKITQIDSQPCHQTHMIACFNSKQNSVSFPKHQYEHLKSMSRIYRASTLIHEAAHRDTDGHSQCLRESYQTLSPSDVLPELETSGDNYLFNKGTLACDSSLGANMVESLFSFNISKFCTNCDVSTQKDARRRALQVIKKVQDHRWRGAFQEDWFGTDPAALYQAALDSNRLPAVKHYFKNNLGTSLKGYLNEEQATHLAARSGDLEFLSSLAERGLDLRAENGNGVTPLLISLENSSSSLDIFHFLLLDAAKSEKPKNSTYLTEALWALIIFDARPELKDPKELELAVNDLIRLGANPFLIFSHVQGPEDYEPAINTFDLAIRRNRPDIHQMMKRAWKKWRENE